MGPYEVDRYLEGGFEMRFELRNGELYVVLTGPLWVGGPVRDVLSTAACRPARKPWPAALADLDPADGKPWL